MKRRILLALPVVAAIALSLPVAGARAELSDADQVKAAVAAFHAALGSLDLAKMEAVWAHDGYVMLVNPRDKAVSVGWDAVRKNWETTFGFWTEVKAEQKDGPHVHVAGNIAWASGVAEVSGKPKNGAQVPGVPTFENDVLEKRNGRWVLVSHSAWRMAP